MCRPIRPGRGGLRRSPPSAGSPCGCSPPARRSALVAVTFNTIRLQILTQREEIEVSKLIGATDGFIRRPFYYLGVLQGVAGGAIAVAIVWVALALLNREVRVLAESFGSAFRLSFLPMARRHARLSPWPASSGGWARTCL